MLFYRAAVDLSRPTLNYVAGIVPAPSPGDQVTVAAAEPRPVGSPAAGAPAQRRDVRRGHRGLGVSVATARRYVEEIVALLSARSPKLRAALRKARPTS